MQRIRRVTGTTLGFDLVIRDGTVVDGSGLAPFRADVGIRGGLIASIGHITEKGKREISAEGHVVTPGFIDGHTHMDAQVFWDPQGTCSCWHGVTTAVMGHCGFTLAPAKADQRALVVRNLERAEDISPAALSAGIEWTWETFRDYLNAVDRTPKGINYAANVGHSALRTWAMGERAFEETASEGDLVAMERELKDALEAGAVGFTTTRSTSHETSDNRPVASRLASWGEVHRLVCGMGALGRGIFQITPEPEYRSNDDAIRSEACGRMRDLAIDSRVPMTFGIPGTPEGIRTFDLLESTAAGGGRMFGLTNSRGLAIILSFKTQLPFDGLPSWKTMRSLPLPEQRAALEDRSSRERLVAEANHGDYGRAIGAEARKPDYDMMRVMDSPIPSDNATVGELARCRGVDPVDLIIDLALASDFQQMFMQPVSKIDERDLLYVLKHPRTVMTFSDSGAHVSQIVDCSIQTHLLAYWVRQRQEISLPEAVRMLTLAPATAWGFSDRGLLRAGLAADINIFDPETVAPEMPTVEVDLPGGAKRLMQRASGFLATVVGGEVTLENGMPTGALPGRLIRGPLGVVD